MNAEVAVLGIPFDNMASMRPGLPSGAASAPGRLHPIWVARGAGGSVWVLRHRRNATLLSGVRIVDAGDVDVRLDATVTRERTTSHARSIIDRSLFWPRSAETTQLVFHC